MGKFIKATILPDRGAKEKKSFRFLDHTVPVPDEKLTQMKNGERILEARLINEWRRTPGRQDAWPALVAWQIPLFDGIKQESEKKGWGKVDLLGLSSKGFPIVVELKVGKNSGDTPLAALLEALSYALVIAKQWGKLRKELFSVRACSLPYTLAKKDELKPFEVGLAILGPEDYWKHWQKKNGKFTKSISRFNALLENMRNEYQFSVDLLCVDSEDKPTGIRARKDMPACAQETGYSSWEVKTS